MKGGVTYAEMDERKRKAVAFDEALAYLNSHADNESSVAARDILRTALRERTEPAGPKNGDGRNT